MQNSAFHRRALSLAAELRSLPATMCAQRIVELRFQDAALAGAVEALLAQESLATQVGAAGGVPAVLSPHDAATILPDALPDPVMSEARDRGRVFGSYTLLHLIGEGGMGAVYLAQQAKPKRIVALKLIRPGLVTPKLLRRFEHETEVLAMLQHPGIAQIYEAGTAKTADGEQPFFAMEYVRGMPLTSFVREHALDVRAKVALFIKICDAVQHAHQRGIIHRDLKPGNILVETTGDGAHDSTLSTLSEAGLVSALQDRAPSVAQSGAYATVESGGGSAAARMVSARTTAAASGYGAMASGYQPKILDFGIARTTDASARQQTMQTEMGQLIGTIPYMSPEQISGDTSAIDTRSDVYTLGVILYELLAGRLPHAVSDKTIPEAVRTISQEEPAPLSGLDRQLKGDLQTIVGKALEKSRTRRYQSANELAADLHRYLRDEPILARPPTMRYQFSKFAARNRAVVLGSAVAVVALVAGVIFSSIQAVRAERARVVAREEAEFAKSANEFLTGMLGAANPDQNNERELTVREMLDRAAERLEGGRSRKVGDGPERETGQQAAREAVPPRVAMSLHSTLSTTYRSLGKPDKALDHAKQAVTLAEGLYGQQSAEAIDVRRTLAMALTELGKFDEALVITRACLAELERQHGPDHPESVRVHGEVGRTLLEAGQYKEALEELEPTLGKMIVLFGEVDNDTVTTMDHLGLAFQRLADFEKAERFARRALAIREELFGSNGSAVTFSLNNLANIAQKTGRNEEAAALLHRALEIRTARLDADHPSVLVAMSNLAVAYAGLGKLQAAEDLLRQSWAMQSKKLGENHPKTLSALGNLAYIIEEKGDLVEAERLMRMVVAARRGNGNLSAEGWGEMNNLAMLLQRMGKPGEAEPLFVELLAGCAKALPTDHYVHAIFRNNFGDVQTDLAGYAQAEELLTSSHDALSKAFKPGHPRLAKSAARLVRLYTLTNRPELAARFAPAP